MCRESKIGLLPGSNRENREIYIFVFKYLAVQNKWPNDGVFQSLVFARSHSLLNSRMIILRVCEINATYR